jgi:hypothetical protein
MRVGGFDVPDAIVQHLRGRDKVHVWDLYGRPAVPGAHPVPLPSWLVVGTLGNGDDIGLYWPEEGASGPIVLSSSHDVYGFVPEASSFERWLGFDGDGADLLAADPDSPLHRVVAGHAAQEAGDLDGADAHYSAALAVLPWYGAARAGRARVRRRQRRPEAAADLFEVLLGPFQLDGRSFWGSVCPPEPQETARTQLLRLRPPDVAGAHGLVWRALPGLNLRYHPSEPVEWRPLDRLCRELFDAGYAREALRVHHSLVHVRLMADALDLAAHLREQADMYRAIGDAARAEYVEAVLAAS